MPLNKQQPGLTEKVGKFLRVPDGCCFMRVLQSACAFQELHGSPFVFCQARLQRRACSMTQPGQVTEAERCPLIQHQTTAAEAPSSRCLGIGCAWPLLQTSSARGCQVTRPMQERESATCKTIRKKLENEWGPQCTSAPRPDRSCAACGDDAGWAKLCIADPFQTQVKV